MDFKFEVGQQVYAWRKSYFHSTWLDFLDDYPSHIARINCIGNTIDIHRKDSVERSRDFCFNPSDLSPVFSFGGKKYVWDGEERTTFHGDIYVTRDGNVRRAHWGTTIQEHKILKPLEVLMEGVNTDSTSYQKQSPKWKSIKPITFTALIDAGAREPTLTKAIQKAIERGYNVSDVIKADDAQAIAEELGEGDWLQRHGLIEKVEEERTYHVGQRFKSFGPFPGFYRLAGIRSSVALVGEVSWGFWRLPISVKDCGAITEDEFVQIAGTTYKFELIS